MMKQEIEIAEPTDIKVRPYEHHAKDGRNGDYQSGAFRFGGVPQHGTL